MKRTKISITSYVQHKETQKVNFVIDSPYLSLGDLDLRRGQGARTTGEDHDWGRKPSIEGDEILSRRGRGRENKTKEVKVDKTDRKGNKSLREGNTSGALGLSETWSVGSESK